jgi:GNAT superfamily N-acetyltransferase
LLSLYAQLHARDPLPEPNKAEKAWSAMLSSGLIQIIVATEADHLVSTCTLTIVPNLTRSASPYALIENVVTDRDHRRRGLGGAVLRDALRCAWDADCYKVMLATGSQNPATLRFYEETGFRRGKTCFQADRPA